MSHEWSPDRRPSIPEAAMGITPETLSGLLSQHFGALVAWSGLRDGSAEDVVQEAFVRLSGQVTPPANPVAWLYATTRYLASNERRATGRRVRRERMTAGSESREGTAWITAEAGELAAFLLTLPDELGASLDLTRSPSSWGDRRRRCGATTVAPSTCFAIGMAQ